MPTVPDDDLWQAVCDAMYDAICDGDGRHRPQHVAHYILALPAASRLALARALCPDTHVVMPKEPSGTQGLRTHLSNAG